jgi:predicted RNase H-like HicB family nuclease
MNPSLRQEMKHFGETVEEQIEKNKEALELIRSWQETEYTESEKIQAQEEWTVFKEVIDSHRSRKLFSEL